MKRALEVLRDSEKWRLAGVANFYRKSIVLAVVLQPGILMRDLGKAMGIPAGSVATAVRALEKKGLVRKEEAYIKTNVREAHRVARLFPTPYAKDLAGIQETL